ncbi:hypothetical protein JYT28_00605 [Desulfobulbus sp. AH-315-M07]|nr:hypothetical protein [Desulfobulbus sp. AH-315-M07]
MALTRVIGILAAVVLVSACSDESPAGIAPSAGAVTSGAGTTTSSSSGVGGGGGSGGSSSSSSSAGVGGGTPDNLGGTFQIIKEGVTQTFDYRLDAGELIYCKHYTELGNLLKVRLAEDFASEGDSGPHLDIQVCAYDGSGTVPVRDPYGGGCTAVAGWDVWWHEIQFSSWVNTVNATPCTLELSLANSGVLSGSFECVPLTKGNDVLELRNGSFSCQVALQ